MSNLIYSKLVDQLDVLTESLNDVKYFNSLKPCQLIEDAIESKSVAEFIKTLLLIDDRFNLARCDHIIKTSTEIIQRQEVIAKSHNNQKMKIYHECLETLNPIATEHISSLLNLGLNGLQMNALLEKLGYIYLAQEWQPTDKGKPYVVKVFSNKDHCRRYIMWNRHILIALKNDIKELNFAVSEFIA